MMDLAYAPSLSDGLIARLEEAARDVGLPLHETELIGQDAYLSRAFVRSVRAGDHRGFLEVVDWSTLRSRLGERRTTTATVPEPPRGRDVAEA